MMNMLVPGCGVIVLGQPWLGTALAVWFALGAEMALCGVLIAPASLPGVVTVMGAGLAGTAWFVAQGLLVARIRFLRSVNLVDELTILRRIAEEALARNDTQAAKPPLLIALSIDDSDLPTHMLWARWVLVTSSRSRARRAWRRVARLDRHGRFASEIDAALDHLQKHESGRA